ncbi:MAG: hypothetical protein AMJ79_04330 [Phycisphaerae bacterium SM23_30]|nr:MAG: hypothetical protein AMJ79_04330 [Phycisphaerae bacterium SM23_30]
MKCSSLLTFARRIIALDPGETGVWEAKHVVDRGEHFRVVFKFYNLIEKFYKTIIKCRFELYIIQIKIKSLICQ